MSNLPTSIRAVLGLAATAVEEARKLPHTLPTVAATIPMVAASTAMQLSLRVQQQIATFAARGDEVLSHMRGTSAEAPAWATFDDEPVAGSATAADGSSRAAFDRIDYEHTGFAEGDDGPGRWDAVGVSDDPGSESAAAQPVGGENGDEPVDEPVQDVSPAGPQKSAARKATPRAREPLKEAAKKAKPSAPPNPVTMAAEIERAHEAEAAEQAAEIAHETQQEPVPERPADADTQAADHTAHPGE
jgi:hypothetical protein